MASSLCKIILTTVTLAAFSVILTVDAQSFTKPIRNTNVHTYGNLSGSVDFSFTYTVPDNNRIASISCGYGSTYVAQKKNTQPAIMLGGFVGRAEIVTDITGSSLTIKLKNLNFNDAKALSCLLIYDSLPYYSGTYSLSIYERPRFIDCLNAGIVNINLKNEFTLNEGQTLNSTCINYGNPAPFLRCSVLNKDGFVDDGATTSSERRNYTAQPPTQRLLFYNIRRTATKVRCVADGGVFTGKATVEKNVVVDYAPEAPEKIEPIETTYNSIKFKWTAPKDSGRSTIFVYYLTATHPNGIITGRNYTTPTTNPLLEYTFVGLQRESDYPIGVSGYNSVGQGKVRTSTIRTVPYKAPERPRFIDCLNAGIVNINFRNEFTLNEGQTLNSTCINYGNPVPFLQCFVLNKDGFVDNGATTSSERRNYTAQPPTQRLLFYNIRRTATKVRCVADGGVYTGKATVEKNVVVDYAPEAPEKIEPIEATYNSIKFKWTAPKYSGRSKIFVYYLTATHPNGIITGKNFSTPTTNPLLEYTFVGLQKESDYPIGVSGYNLVGQGKVTTSTIRTVPYKAPGLSIGSIVGIAFGVLIFIGIVVIIVFFVPKKRQEGQTCAARREENASKE